MTRLTTQLKNEKLPNSASPKFYLETAHSSPTRKTFQTWNALSTHWRTGLIDRASLINKRFKKPVYVQNKNYPLSNFPLCGNFNEPRIHSISNLEILDLKQNAHDLILLSPYLQWTHDVPGMLFQAYQALAEGGFFAACFFGQNTLYEFKSICAEIDLDHNKGLEQRFIPTIHTKDAAMLIQRAGFSCPTADIEHLTFNISSVKNLIIKLRNSNFNKNNFSTNDKRPLPRNFLNLANQLYKDQFSDLDQSLKVSVDLIFICGWKEKKQTQFAKTAAKSPITDFK
ncbi:MAG: hypothetical protein Q8S21_01815 [Candidatus Paracaedibacteraceae bacterium]|nr:hypothetical protein [Candidatus Paracaedibacteraceae bacterium]